MAFYRKAIASLPGISFPRGMTTDTDISIEFSFRLLAALWVAGVLCLVGALAMQEDAPKPCSFAQLHFDACPN
ncbi:hypothetical protein [Kordiimonas aestuarii]|uniref:hypothetical protein n=1 Tax=Kordiimonas aestuarii TaxID=1005925 RepID=UPI0021D115C9|nr:hypothetical protein [Kordiimonas aestuarii]